MNELKPCPFCGNEVYPAISASLDDGNTRCRNCGAKMPTKVWDTRPIEDALRARIAELEAKQRWIPVSERLPEEYEDVLVIFTGFNLDGGLWMKMRVCSVEDWEYMGNPTHWMPLPEPPEDISHEPA